MGDFGWRWLAIDLVWAVVGGVAIGTILGMAIGYLVVHLRRERNQAIGRDEFLTLGLIALAYGLALLFHAYGFLAVFAAGLALRRVESRLTSGDFDETMDQLAHGEEEERATGAETAPVHMAEAVLGFNEKLGNLGELAVVLVIGSLLAPDYIPWQALWFVPLLLFVIRPLAVRIGLAGSDINRTERHFVSWFGIRGIGSLYYLMYAIVHGLPDDLASELAAITLTTIAVSIIVHGITVTPLMTWYENRGQSGARTSPKEPEPAA
jgi:NhaP-type Na+/H+ or K+/H+ antiporter